MVLGGLDCAKIEDSVSIRSTLPTRCYNSTYSCRARRLSMPLHLKVSHRLRRIGCGFGGLLLDLSFSSGQHIPSGNAKNWESGLLFDVKKNEVRPSRSNHLCRDS